LYAFCRTESGRFFEHPRIFEVRSGFHLSIPIHNSSQAAECGWSEATLIYRRICIARAKGSQVEADEIENTVFAAALVSLRNDTCDLGEWEARLRQLRETEEARIGEAAALAELLAPMLARNLQAATAAAYRPPGSSPPAPISPPRRVAPRAAPRGIADFIDEMISQTDLQSSPTPACPARSFSSQNDRR
jgi:hypothetical protein